MMASTGKYRITRVPALLVGFLASKGGLKLPPEPDPTLRGYRPPGIREFEALEWIVAYEGPAIEDWGSVIKVEAACGFLDRYDFHTASDVRDVIVLTGFTRAMVALFNYLRFDAKEHGRRVVGTFDLSNYALRKLMRDGCDVDELRVRIEDLT